MTLTLDTLDHATQSEFTALLEGTYEHSPWIAAAAWQHRPFATLAALKHGLVAAVRENDTPVEYVIFPDEGHGFQKKANRITAAEAYLAFLDKYLKGKEVSEDAESLN